MVQVGESLASIAAHYGTTVEVLLSLNELSADSSIYVGQALNVPGESTFASIPPVSATCVRTHVVRIGENLSSIAAQYRLSVSAVAQASGIANPNLVFAGQSLCIPGTHVPLLPPSTPIAPVNQIPSTRGTYTVRGGDTLFSIALAHGVSVQELVTANGIANPSFLRPGQQLVIPGGSTAGLPALAPIRPVAAPAPASGTFTVLFYNNPELLGDPVLTRSDPVGTQYNWRLNAPGSGVVSHNFSARWDGQFHFAKGLHRFRVNVHGGMRLYIDGALIQDSWVTDGKTYYEMDVWLEEGQHLVRVEYQEQAGEASLLLRWVPVTLAPIHPDPPQAPPPPRPGILSPATEIFTVQFFNNLTLAGPPVYTRTDPPATKYDWGLGTPAPGVNADNFSVRMEGHFRFAEGHYRFYTTKDDGLKLYVDGTLIANSWVDLFKTTGFNDFYLSEGIHHIRLDYYERREYAFLWLRWYPLALGISRTGLADPGLVVPGLNLYTPETQRELFQAIQASDIEKVRELVISRGFPHFPNLEGIGEKALHAAAVYDSLEILRFLLNHPEADPNVRFTTRPGVSNTGYRTPLHSAAIHGKAVAVQLLLAYGADHSLLDERGDSVLDLAYQRGDEDTIEALLTHGAKRSSKIRRRR